MSALARTSERDRRTRTTNEHYTAIESWTRTKYTYDPVGNRLSSLGVSPYTNNVSNELTSTPSSTYTFDNNGNTLTSVTGSNTTTYAWDFENRLTSATLPGSGGTATFKYDPFGRRIYKSSTSATSIYAYDGDNLIEETNSSGTVVARYSQTQNIDEPMAMLRSGATSYFHADGLGSVTSLSSSAGAIANTYTYDSYGKLAASTGSLVNRFQYTARESDTETGLYYYRTRYYDPLNGRFLREDPIGFLGGDRNLYRYVWGSTLNHRDPSGLVGVGLSLSAGGFAGGGPGVGGSVSLGSMWFPYPGGNIQDVGGYLSIGGFAGSHGICKSYDDNQTGGLSGSAGPGLVLSNGNSLADISGPFNNTSYTLLLLQIDFAYSPDNGVWTLNLSEGFGLGFSKYVTNTYTNPTSPPQSCSCN